MSPLITTTGVGMLCFCIRAHPFCNLEPTAIGCKDVTYTFCQNCTNIYRVMAIYLPDEVALKHHCPPLHCRWAQMSHHPPQPEVRAPQTHHQTTQKLLSAAKLPVW